MDMMNYQEKPINNKKLSVKMIPEGDYIAEVSVELICDETDWSPYLSVREAEKLDKAREILRNGNIGIASRVARIFRLLPVAA